uniref:Uncharacterized protein n=1 Tax=Panagrellus redivivus TaxID=6233 RepID=A0A7E4VDI0_PANRE
MENSVASDSEHRTTRELVFAAGGGDGRTQYDQMSSRVGRRGPTVEHEKQWGRGWKSTDSTTQPCCLSVWIDRMMVVSSFRGVFFSLRLQRWTWSSLSRFHYQSKRDANTGWVKQSNQVTEAQSKPRKGASRESIHPVSTVISRASTK